MNKVDPYYLRVDLLEDDAIRLYPLNFALDREPEKGEFRGLKRVVLKFQ